MPNTTLTIPNIRAEIKTALGGSQVNVELVETDIDKVIADANRVYNRYRPQRKKTSLTVSTSTKKYTISHTNLLGVVDVEFLDPEIADTMADPFVASKYQMTTVTGSFGELAQQFSYLEDARRIASSEPEWFAEWEDGVYYLYIDVKATMYCSYTYTWSLNNQGVPIAGDATYGVANYGDYGLKHVRETDLDWFMDFMIARAKQMLGRALRKHGGVPTSEGGVDQMDGQELVTEGAERERELMETIRQRQHVTAPVIG